jgi:trehalose-phosphatase
VNQPVHLFEHWERLAGRLARPEQVALFSDFDGTLAPICSNAADARMLRGTRQLLSACVEQGVLAGIVSGRRLADVRGRVGVRGIWYAGVHGYCLVSPGNRRFQRLNHRERERIAGAAGRLSRSLAAETGISVERKEAAVTIHYRGAPIASRRRAGRFVRSLMDESPGLRLVPGRKVWEILPLGKVDKASAVRFVLRQSGSRPVTVFLGDDAADEKVFGGIRGITVLVGRRRRTAARYWLRSPAEVRQFLKQCLQLWK